MGVGKVVVSFVFAILIPIFYFGAIAVGAPVAREPIVPICVGVLELLILISAVGDLKKHRSHRQAKPSAPLPAVPPRPIKVFSTPTDLEEEVLNYITKHGGKISLSRAGKDLGLSEARLNATINKLKEKGKLDGE
jgi:hypothetical protein